MREKRGGFMVRKRIVNEKEGEVLLSLYEDEVHRQLALLYYIKGYSVSECSEIMNYSKRHTERLKNEIDRIAIFSLLNIVVCSESKLKLAKIRKIFLGGDD